MMMGQAVQAASCYALKQGWEGDWIDVFEHWCWMNKVR